LVILFFRHIASAHPRDYSNTYRGTNPKTKRIANCYSYQQTSPLSNLRAKLCSDS
jgi:hypothetical protein